MGCSMVFLVLVLFSGVTLSGDWVGSCLLFHHSRMSENFFALLHGFWVGLWFSLFMLSGFWCLKASLRADMDTRYNRRMALKDFAAALREK